MQKTLKGRLDFIVHLPESVKRVSQDMLDEITSTLESHFGEVVADVEVNREGEVEEASVSVDSIEVKRVRGE